MLVDEADEVVFSNLAWYEKKVQAATVIAFTATAAEEQESHEGQILKQLFDGCIYESKLELKPIPG